MGKVAHPATGTVWVMMINHKLSFDGSLSVQMVYGRHTMLQFQPSRYGLCPCKLVDWKFVILFSPTRPLWRPFSNHDVMGYRDGGAKPPGFVATWVAELKDCL